MAYCTHCGTELATNDRFCAGCGIATNVPPATSAPPTRIPPTVTRSSLLGPAVVMVGVFLFLSVADIAWTMATDAVGRSFSFALGWGIGDAIATVLAWAVVVVLLGGIYYLTARKNGTTFAAAIFNWPMAILAAVLTLVAIPA
jgi:succinate dehydrogenase/fumarate reductase cytochrome b subunit